MTTKTTREKPVDDLDVALEGLTQEKAVFILKLLHHSEQIPRLRMLKAVDLTESLRWLS